MDPSNAQAIRELLASGKTAQALSLLLEDTSAAHYIQAVAISARYHELNEKVHKQLISRQDEVLENARIMDDLLHLISFGQTDKPSLKSQNTEGEPTAKSSIKGDKNIVIQDVNSSGINIQITKKE